jgi:hypothetical protein
MAFGYGGVSSPAAGVLGQTPIAPTPFSMFGDPSTFKAAATTQAGDYDKIMAQYGDLAKSYSLNPITASTVKYSPVSFNSVTPQTSQYSQSGDVTSSLADLSNLSTTGGYSDADIANIRARDISPIRSIYFNANQNAERAKALGGGYSPNFNATQAQMARDEANKIGDITTAANAGIAQNVAANKLSAAPAYASASAAANAAKTAADARNADIINRANEFNSQGSLQANTTNSQGTLGAGEFNTEAGMNAAMANRSGTLGATQGMASLYGTTPALTNTFGNQVVQAGQLGLSQQQINNQKWNAIGGGSFG